MNDGFDRYFSPMYCDADGKPVERTPVTHPYSYDAFVVWGQKTPGARAIYTDRLLDWDYGKHDRLCQKHFGDRAQTWYPERRHPEQIQAFLRDWFENPNLVLTMVMQGCNVAHGYPIWILFYKDKP